MRLKGESLIDGSTSAKLLHSTTSLSFWGGVDPQTGAIIDRHHPLFGQSLAGSIIAVPSSRGSCTGSMVMLELLLVGKAPAGLIFEHREEVLTLGVLVAKSLFDMSIPVIALSSEDFSQLRQADYISIHGATVTDLLSSDLNGTKSELTAAPPASTELELSVQDQQVLAGEKGVANKIALEIVTSFARIQGASQLIDVSRAHIDSCIYTGPASLRFPEKLRDLGAKFSVPTSLNSISIDSRRWKELGMDPVISEQAMKLANAHISMGATTTFTCAPYGLRNPPKAGEQVGWSESNAVIFANSVLGAHTQKYPDLLDTCIAVTGRAPLAGCHTRQGRQPRIRINLTALGEVDDATYAVLGYLAGQHARNHIPMVYGIEHLKPSTSDLKNFSAAFGTSSSLPMFHMMGVTPEANEFSDIAEDTPEVCLDEHDVQDCLRKLNTAEDSSVGLVSLGNPHFLLEEFRTLALLCDGLVKHASVDFIITTNREVLEDVQAAGYLEPIEKFGALIITDTCWCMLSEPVIRPHVRNIMTNSAKYAHYAPAIVQRGVHFGSLQQCVRAACTGEHKP